MKQKRNREINFFGMSFLDVLANTIGGLAFLLVLAMLMIGIISGTPPLILTQKLPLAYQNSSYQTWLSAREGLGKFTWELESGELPPGLQLDAHTGELSGQLSAGAITRADTTYRFTVACISPLNEGRQMQKTLQKYELTVFRRKPVQSRPLKITALPKFPDAFVDHAYALTLAAEGGQGPYRWRALNSLPPGLALDAEGHLRGTPRQEGDFSFGVSVTAADGEAQRGSFSVSISERHPPPPPPPPLALVTRSLPEAVAQRAYRVWMAGSGGTPPYRWSFPEAAPQWLQRGADAQSFLGAPRMDDIGEKQVRIRLSDASDNSIDSTFTLTVLRPTGQEARPLVLETASLPDARVGKPYQLFMSVKGGYPPYQWRLMGEPESGAPAFVAEAGKIEDAPESPGRFSYTVNVQDQANQQKTARLSLAVHPGEVPVRVLTREAPPARVGIDYHFALSGVGGYPPYTWNADALPPGLALDSTSGIVRGRPQAAGTWRSAIAMQDAAGTPAGEAVKLDFLVLTQEGARKLVIKTRTLPTLLAGDSVEIALACEGGIPPYRWRSEPALPQGLKLADTYIAGRSRQSGEFPIELIVEDAAGSTAAADVPLVVEWLFPWWLLAALIATALLLLLLLLWFLRKRPQPQPLKILTTSIPNARASCEYRVQLACIGGNPPYRWRLEDGELPPGLKLTEDGVIHGIPFEGVAVEHSKNVVFTVTALDQSGQSVKQTL